MYLHVKVPQAINDAYLAELAERLLRIKDHTRYNHCHYAITHDQEGNGFTFLLDNLCWSAINGRGLLNTVLLKKTLGHRKAHSCFTRLKVDGDRGDIPHDIYWYETIEEYRYRKVFGNTPVVKIAKQFIDLNYLRVYLSAPGIIQTTCQFPMGIDVDVLYALSRVGDVVPHLTHFKKVILLDYYQQHLAKTGQ